MKRIENIMEALSRHEDNEAINILNTIGTDCPIDDVRELAVKALIKRNSKEALELVISKKGKGVNDLSAKVAMTAINELLAIKEKEIAIEVLDRTIEENEEQDVKDTARSVKALMSFSI